MSPDEWRRRLSDQDGLCGVVRCLEIAGAGTVDLLMIPGWVTHLALDRTSLAGSGGSSRWRRLRASSASTSAGA